LSIIISKQIIEHSTYPENPEQAILYACEKAEKQFTQLATTGSIERSGSCGVCAFISGKIQTLCILLTARLGQKLFIFNVGDSRAVGSFQRGKGYKSLTLDHKPLEPSETKRITENGGKIYQ
jgi:serine/threonine protein phosphatase PrpC